MIAIGNFLFRYRNALFPLASVLLLLPGPDLLRDPLDAAGSGAVLAACGEFVRMLTIGLDYIVRGGRQGKVYAEGMVISGIYAHTRNPMYVGNVLICAGLALASNSLTAVVAALPLVCFAYIAIVAAEEKYLRGKFGSAYDAYCQAVPRWLPRANGLRDTLAGARFHWRRVIVKEYGTPAGWIAVLCAITIYNLWSDGSLDERPGAVRAIWLVVSATFALWLLARVLKKTRALQAE